MHVREPAAQAEASVKKLIGNALALTVGGLGVLMVKCCIVILTVAKNMEETWRSLRKN